MSGETTPHKQDVLLTFYRTAWDEMCWRRNAGYRTIIFGFAYLGLLLALVLFNRSMPFGAKICLSTVIAVATVFGGGWLTSNYNLYMNAMGRMVKIEEHLGAFDPDFLGRLGAFCPPGRRTVHETPLTRDPVSLWSVIAFVVGGLLTAVAILVM